MALEFKTSAGINELKTDGDYGPLKISGNQREGYNFYAHNTFDGATIKLQVSYNEGSNWVDITDSTLTAEGQILLNLRGSFLLRANISSAGASTDIRAGIS